MNETGSKAARAWAARLTRFFRVRASAATPVSKTKQTPIFLGAGCDSKFVDLTCAMLSSVDDNGDIPEAATVLVSFGLTRIDKAKLRLSAGRLGNNMRFLDVNPGSTLIPSLPTFDFPLPMLGCLIAPNGVDALGARMLVLDSDMIINSSLRPLFDADLQGHPIAAVKDMLVEPELKVRGRELNANYFNTGLLLIDVDRWNKRACGDLAMQWLADQPQKPEWPDQDALNHVIGSDWLRLDRSWNLAYCGEERLFTLKDYEAAKICHFSGAKPTEHRDHPAVPLFDRQVARVEEKIGSLRRNSRRVDSCFTAIGYQVLLGRELEEPAIARERDGQSTLEVISGFVGSQEFKGTAAMARRVPRSLPQDRWRGPLTLAHRLWAADLLPLLPATIVRVEQAKTWSDLVGALIEDERLMSLAENDALSDAVTGGCA